MVIILTDVPEYKEDAWSNPAPDPARGSVDHFEWETNTYIYKDEIKVDSVKYDWGPIKSMPDYSVRIENGYTPPKPRILKRSGSSLGGTGFIRRESKELPEIILGGKRYKQRIMGDGSIKLIPIR